MRIVSLLLFLLLPALATQGVYRVNAWIYENDTIELEDLKLLFFSPTYYERGSYTIHQLDKNDKDLFNMSFPVSFLIMTDPPEASDISMIDLFIPYNKDAEYITINHGEKEIFRQDLSITCNKDGNCGKFESFLSCPEDCTQENDDICVPAENGVCDPQCAEGVDPDCSKGIQLSWWYVIPFMFILLVIFVMWRKRQ